MLDQDDRMSRTEGQEVVLSFKEISRGRWKKVNARRALVVIYFNLFILNSFLN